MARESIDTNSTSLLDFDWGSVEKSTIECDIINPSFIDPLYLDIFLEICEEYKKYIPKEVNFSYRLIKERYLRVKKYEKGLVLFTSNLAEFSKPDFFFESDSKFAFIFGRKKFKRLSSNKEGTDNIENQKIKAQEYEEKQDEIINKQINDNINIFYIDDADDFGREIKNILKYIFSGKTFAPKTKCFKPENKKEYFVYLLEKIPGISKCVASNIGDKYLNFYNFYKTLVKEGKECLSGFIVHDAVSGNSRNLSKVQIDKIYGFFMDTKQI